MSLTKDSESNDSVMSPTKDSKDSVMSPTKSEECTVILKRSDGRRNIPKVYS